MSDILNQSADDTSEAIAAGTLDPVDLMQTTLDRIAATNGQANAIVSLQNADDLLAQAAAARDAPRKGWLHGIPLAVKDLANVAGIPTSMGPPALAGTVPKTSDLNSGWAATPTIRSSVRRKTRSCRVNPRAGLLVALLSHWRITWFAWPMGRT